MIVVTVYIREDCQLCEQVLEDLNFLGLTIPHSLEVIDVESEPKLNKEFGFELPVVQVGPYRLKAPITRQELQMTLNASQDRERHIEMIENSPALEEVRQGGAWTFADSLVYWLSRHYVALFNTLVIVYLGFSFLAPVFMKLGAIGPANIIYRSFSIVCHQLAYRSLFLFGEQPFYPRAEAGVKDILTWNQATGREEGNDSAALLAARTFVGNERVGFKVALCQRDLAIYGGILMFGLLFALTNRRIPGIRWYVWIIFGIAPIALDGLSQLISQPPFSLLPYRESTPVFRLLTGFLFGFFTAWFGYPMVEESMADTRTYMEHKLQNLGSQKTKNLKFEKS